MSRVRTWAARLARGHTRLALRLFLFNALLVFLPVAGLWYLDAYEQHLLEQQERAMVQQARLLAAALAEFPDLSAIGDGLGPQRLLDRLEQTSDVRLRIIAPDGRVVADSQRVAGPDGREDTGATSAPEMRVLRGRWTYRGLVRATLALADLQRYAAPGGGDDPRRLRAHQGPRGRPRVRRRLRRRDPAVVRRPAIGDALWRVAGDA